VPQTWLVLALLADDGGIGTGGGLAQHLVGLIDAASRDTSGVCAWNCIIDQPCLFPAADVVMDRRVVSCSKSVRLSMRRRRVGGAAGGAVARRPQRQQPE